MKLPTIDFPIYEVTLLSQEKPVRFRPFLVKEQKLMMMAVEAKDIENTVKSVKQIISNCILDPIDVDNLPTVDIELLFLNLRAKSMGEVLNLFFKCTNKIGDVGLELPCGMIIEVDVPVEKIEIINKDTPKKIMLNDTIGIQMKYPSLGTIDKILNNKNQELSVSLAASCIDYVFDADSVYYAKDATQEEMEKFVEEIPAEKFELLEKFIDKVPKVRYKTKKTCSKCKYEHDFVLEGLNDFFL
jgi:DNA-directed RNA polymerase subunit M/transcription elongation factor TFIIS